jgi:hypothetical protein
MTAGPAPDAPSRTELAVASAVIAVAAALKMLVASRLRVNTDEPQHLHVVWAWATGRVPYRDVFDNHMPLFHVLYAPVLRAIGERADVVVRMRWAALPLWALDVVLVAGIARALFSARAALAAAVVAAVLPPFFLLTTEFRADDLWAALWLGAIAVMSRGAMTRGRAFTVGLFLGAAMATSQKTVFLLLGLGLAAAVSAARVFGVTEGAARLRRIAAPAAAGLVVAPLGVLAFFARLGAVDAFVYGAVLHNALPAVDWSVSRALRLVCLPAIAAVTDVAARRWLPRESDPRLALRRLVVFLAGGFYVAAIHGLWPLASSQNDLPALGVAAALTPLLPALRRGSGRTLAVAGVVGLAATLGFAAPWRDGTLPERTFVRDVLALTAEDDFVLDPKGEAIFRPRPFFYAFEEVTRERIRQGLIADDVPERMRATRTYVTFPDSPVWPPRTRAFLMAATIPVGRARVAGQLLAPSADGAATFAIELAGRYAIVSPSPVVGTTLDGAPYEGPRWLARGPHRVDGLAGGPAAVEWARAAERGYSPFHRQDVR